MVKVNPSELQGRLFMSYPALNSQYERIQHLSKVLEIDEKRSKKHKKGRNHSNIPPLFPVISVESIGVIIILLTLPNAKRGCVERDAARDHSHQKGHYHP